MAIISYDMQSTHRILNEASCNAICKVFFKGEQRNVDELGTLMNEHLSL